MKLPLLPSHTPPPISALGFQNALCNNVPYDAGPRCRPDPYKAGSAQLGTSPSLLQCHTHRCRRAVARRATPSPPTTIRPSQELTERRGPREGVPLEVFGVRKLSLHADAELGYREVCVGGSVCKGSSLEMVKTHRMLTVQVLPEGAQTLGDLVRWRPWYSSSLLSCAP